MKKIVSMMLALAACLMLTVPALAANTAYAGVPNSGSYSYVVGPSVGYPRYSYSYGYPYYNWNNSPYVARSWDGSYPYGWVSNGYVYDNWTNSYRGFGNFQRTRAYTSGTFKDVPAGAWYEGGVRTLYELGLTTEGTYFGPKSGLTLGEIVSLAARIHSTYSGWAIPGDMTELQYALNMGIVEYGQYDNYGDLASRRSFAAIMAKALPDEALRGINTVVDGAIPDVPSSDPGAPGIYALYRAGVLRGSDTLGTFCPNDLITRASAAVITARMLDTTQRRGASLLAPQALSISLSETSIVLHPGQVRSLTAYVYPANTANQNITWGSSDLGVATVDAGGTVTAVRPGNAVIIANTLSGVLATCTVSVVNR